jgi:Fe-S cluster assembly protein SufD
VSLASALRSGDLAQLPGRRDEDWRWTDLRGLIRAVPPASPTVDAVRPNPALAVLKGPEHLYANGRVLHGAELRVAAGETAEIVRRFVSATEGTAHHLKAPVDVGPGARLLLVESFEGQAEGYASSFHAAIRVASGATVERVVLLDDAAEAISVDLTEVELQPGATFRQTVLATGARRQRFETRVRHHGGGATVQLDGLYLLSGQRHSDQTTVVEHLSPDGSCAQLTKGMAQDQARGVFQGRIVVAHGADRTDARMGHHALILSDRAEVDAKPELEIYADDVACAHGNTVGALDEDALFYIMSRGLPEPEARALLVEAFLGEVVDRIAYVQAHELARSWVARALRGGAR